MFVRSWLVGALALGLSGAVWGTPLQDATEHFDAVAAGEVARVMQPYATQATFHWIGGPLDGTYTGPESIRSVWTKFSKANAPLKVTVSHLEQSANPKGATVTANVGFHGKSTIKVRYVLVYRAGKLVNEVWQIDPQLKTE